MHLFSYALSICCIQMWYHKDSSWGVMLPSHYASFIGITMVLFWNMAGIIISITSLS